MTSLTVKKEEEKLPQPIVPKLNLDKVESGVATTSEVAAAARETKPKNAKVEEDETFGDG